MSQELFSVEQVADLLGLHVKTVRNYVRDGRLKAVRIGKQYRISRADVETFTGFPLPLTDNERARRQREAGASCVVRIDAISAQDSSQLAASLEAFARPDRIGQDALRVGTIYDKDVGHFQIM